MLSIVVGDGRALLVESLVAALGRYGLWVAATGRELARVVTAVHRLRPDVCVLNPLLADAALGPAIATIRAASPRTGVLLLVDAAGPGLLAPGAQCRPDGYVHMGRSCAELADAIHRVAAGEVVEPGTGPPPVRVPLPWRVGSLTDREHECLALLVEGEPTEVMAQRLGVTVNTVRSHVQAVMHKLGVHSRLEAAAFAIRHGLVDAAVASTLG